MWVAGSFRGLWRWNLDLMLWHVLSTCWFLTGSYFSKNCPVMAVSRSGPQLVRTGFPACWGDQSQGCSSRAEEITGKFSLGNVVRCVCWSVHLCGIDWCQQSVDQDLEVRYLHKTSNLWTVMDQSWSRFDLMPLMPEVR